MKNIGLVSHQKEKSGVIPGEWSLTAREEQWNTHWDEYSFSQWNTHSANQTRPNSNWTQGLKPNPNLTDFGLSLLLNYKITQTLKIKHI
jgi:hypothetical protein